MVAIHRDRPRFTVGHALGVGWVVIDRLTGWVSYWHPNEVAALSFRDRCERGEAGPPEPNRN